MSFVFRINTKLPYIDALSFNPGEPSTYGGFVIPEARLPLLKTGRYDFVVNWGDGHSSHVTNANMKEAAHHMYSTYDEFQVTITGLIVGWSFEEARNVKRPYDFQVQTQLARFAEMIVEVEQWGCLLANPPTPGMFEGCRYMCITAPPSHFDTLTLDDSTITKDGIVHSDKPFPRSRVALPTVRRGIPYSFEWSRTISSGRLCDLDGN